jgi:threonine dehydrogenase-like Zn-dependent dehydrogenase
MEHRPLGRTGVSGVVCAARARRGADRVRHDDAHNLTLTGGAAPARAYIEELLPDVLDGTIEPGRLFDRTVTLEQVPDGCRAMAHREALKVLIRP